MEYIGDVGYWEEKFTNRENKLLSPEKSLVENIGYFKKGTVLDIACGDGRNSIFLIENGFKVTGVDFSIKALSRLEMFVRENNFTINLKQIDLSKPNSLNSIGVFDNIVINHYRLNKEQLADVEKHTSDKGIIFISGFGHKHRVDYKIRKQDLIQPSDFEDMKKSFELVKYTESEDERGFLVTYIFRKRSI